ncbi:hypothetical protein [Bradyrhizobium sp. Arg816]|nr:hypothetical protein [Bradyrhizobium sp. Arg816]
MRERLGREVFHDLGLTGELIDYHAQWKPVHRADLVFDVVCD